MKASKSTAKMLDAAAALLARDAGASLAEIAEHAGVGRATLHRHFPARRDLIQALTIDSLKRLEEATRAIDAEAESAEQALEMLVEAVVPLGERYQFLSSDPLRHEGGHVHIVHDLRQSRLAALIGGLKAEALIAPDISDAWAAATIDALIYAAWAAVEAGEIARRDAPALVLRTLKQGLGLRQG